MSNIKVSQNRISYDFLMETMNAIRAWADVLKVTDNTSDN